LSVTAVVGLPVFRLAVPVEPEVLVLEEVVVEVVDPVVDGLDDEHPAMTRGTIRARGTKRFKGESPFIRVQVIRVQGSDVCPAPDPRSTGLPGHEPEVNTD
jgi:hypothetical protein